MAQPVGEAQICVAEQARKPLYAVAKYAAEKLSLAFGREYGLPVTILRFWWAFGDTIGGKHLRALIQKTMRNEPLTMAAGAGGTFVSMTDLAVAVELAAASPQASGATYNIGESGAGNRLSP